MPTEPLEKRSGTEPEPEKPAENMRVVYLPHLRIANARHGLVSRSNRPLEISNTLPDLHHQVSGSKS